MFNVIDSAVASQSRLASSKYADALGKLALATKNEQGQFVGPAVECEKVGQVLCFREAAKRLGVGLVTRKQADGKTRCWKVAQADVPARKPRTPKAPAPQKAPTGKKGNGKKA